MHGIPIPGPLVWLANFAFAAILPCGLIALGFFLSKLLTAGRPPVDVRGAASGYFLYALIVAGGLVPAFVFQGSFLGMIFLLASAVWFLLPCLVIMAVLATRSRIKGVAITPKLRTAAFLWCACVGALLVMWMTGAALHESQISSARAYVARAVPVLEAIKTKTGAYPAQLPVSELGQPPALLRGPSGYSSTGGVDYQFFYNDDAGMISSYIFDSSTGAWHYRG